MTEVKPKSNNLIFKIIFILIAVLILAGIGGKLFLNYIAEQAAVSVAKQLFGGDEEDNKSSENQLHQNISPTIAASPTQSSLITVTIKRNSLAGTNWRYQIDVGGGVGGVMIFKKDEGGFVGGTYEENGPEGRINKKFEGVWDKETLILQMGDFPRFKVTVSENGKMMQGKLLEENKDIYYPDDFFKATLEN